MTTSKLPLVTRDLAAKAPWPKPKKAKDFKKPKRKKKKRMIKNLKGRGGK